MASVDIFARTEGCKLNIHVERDGPLAELVAEAYGLLMAAAQGMHEPSDEPAAPTQTPGGTEP